jgi:hypothetical protein
MELVVHTFRDFPLQEHNNDKFHGQLFVSRIKITLIQTLQITLLRVYKYAHIHTISNCVYFEPCLLFYVHTCAILTSACYHDTSEDGKTL